MIFVLPGRVKPYVRMTQRGKYVKPDALQYRDSQTAIRFLLANLMARDGWEMYPPKTALSVVINYQVTERLHNHDADNVIKALLDAMSGIVYPDDRWIDRIELTRSLWVEDRAIVVVTTLYRAGREG